MPRLFPLSYNILKGEIWYGIMKDFYIKRETTIIRRYFGYPKVVSTISASMVYDPG